MNVAFAQARGADADHPGVALQRGDRPAPRIPHAGAQAADELVDHRRDAALVRHTAFDPLGDELFSRLRVRVEIEFVLRYASARGIPYLQLSGEELHREAEDSQAP